MAQISIKAFFLWFFSGIDLVVYFVFYKIYYFLQLQVEAISLSERKDLTIITCSVVLLGFSIMYRWVRTEKLKLEIKIAKEDLKKRELENEKLEIENIILKQQIK